MKCMGCSRYRVSGRPTMQDLRAILNLYLTRRIHLLRFPTAMQEPLLNELLDQIFDYIDSDYAMASAIRTSCWSYHRDLNVRSRGWAIRRISFDMYTGRIVCRKLNTLVLPRVSSRMALQPTRMDNFTQLLRVPASASMVLHVESITLSRFPVGNLEESLRVLLPLLHSLRALRVFRPTRLGNGTGTVSISTTAALPCATRATLDASSVHDATLDEKAITALSRCLQLFSHIDALRMSDVSFSGNIEDKLVHPPLSFPTLHIAALDLGSTNAFVAGDLLRQANCAAMPGTLTICVAYNPS
ncbi:hypothetical protein BC629DRAFT_477814 [Irpex lacteus]|nr:hypothetical protein BC629DRAFT_477814 [Irpex lacteus]